MEDDQRLNEAGGESPSSSKYSSFEDSDFEKYCSANSALGTPSSFSSSFSPRSSSLEPHFKGIFDLRHFGAGVKGSEGLIGSEKDGNFSGLNVCGGGGSDWDEGEDDLDHFGVGVKDSGGLIGIEKDGNLSGLDVGGVGESGDDEDEDDSVYNLHVRCEGEEGSDGNENPLVMGSSVAFGLDDWGGFEEETDRAGLVSLAFDGFGEKKEGGLRMEGIELREDVGYGDVGDSGVVSNGDELVECLEDGSVSLVGIHGSELDGLEEEVRDIHVASCNGSEHDGSSVLVCDIRRDSEFEEYGVGDVSMIGNQDKVGCCVAEKCDSQSVEVKDDTRLATNEMQMEFGLSIKDMEREHQNMNSEEMVLFDKDRFRENEGIGDLEISVDPLSDASNLLASLPANIFGNANAEFSQNQKPDVAQLIITSSSGLTSSNNSASDNLLENHSKLVKADGLAANDLYEEIVNEMEEILLDSGQSPASRFPQELNPFQSHQSLPLRDGGSTASTSGTEDVFPLITQTLRIDGVEVIGAKQKKGDVSLSERLVGVKEYTAYVMRVWSGQDEWKIERRYRDFYTLYRELKTLFADHGWSLPSPWAAIEKESRKILGSASLDVVTKRSILIEECLGSIIHSGFSSSLPTALAWFLCPQDSFHSSSAINTQRTGSASHERGADRGNTYTLGKTISLIVEIRPHKSTKQMLEGQHYKCAGCHKHFDDGMTVMQDFVRTLGWGKPRLCEYTGQLFCSSCHRNDTAVLPARVLHHWDFTQYPVSQLAKSYLDSIYEQPMLCVGGVNPFLFTKVPALHHVTNVSKKIASLLPYVRCPFRVTINRGLGSRRYLLESIDFFALRDFIDLSKGAFAALPVMLETVLRKIKEHITEQCLLCCDVGVPCNARQACNNPSSLIFPFQDDEVEKCPSCGSVYHRPCFKRITACFCGAKLGADNASGDSNNILIRMSSGNLFGRTSSSSSLRAGLLTRLFSKSHPDKKKDHEDGDTVILMSSLPSTTL